MNIRIEIPASSNLKPNTSPFIFTYKDDTFELHCNKDGMLDFVVVTRNVDACNKDYLEDSRKIMESLRQEPEEFPIHPIEKQMINSLKFFENVLFREVDLQLQWDRLQCRYKTENSQEEKLRKDGKVCGGWGRIIRVKRPIPIEDPKAVTCRMEYNEGLEIELTFFRHAIIAIKEQNYVEAFFNLYHNIIF